MTASIESVQNIYHEEMSVDKAQLRQLIKKHRNRLTRLNNDYGIKKSSLKNLQASHNQLVRQTASTSQMVTGARSPTDSINNATLTIQYKGDMMSLKKSREKIKKALKKTKNEDNNTLNNESAEGGGQTTVNIVTGPPSTHESNE